jgi:hypothetical protein
MVELPSHSGGGDDSEESMHRELSGRQKGTAAVAVGIIVVLVILVHILGFMGGS